MAIVKKVKKAQTGTTEKPTKDSTGIYQRRMLSDMDIAFRSSGKLKDIYNKKVTQDVSDLNRQSKKGKPGFDANGFPIPKKRKAAAGAKLTKAKAGKEMIKRADGSTSQRGLWDNIRAAKGSGKKPTAQMLKQERKIKANSKKK